MYRNFHYRVALILLTFALVAVSVAYVREHQQLSRWERAGIRIREGARCRFYMNDDIEPTKDMQPYQKVKNWCAEVNEISPTDPDTLANTIEKQSDVERTRTQMWEDIAREMSREADRRNLDKSFPRVQY